MAKSFTKLLTSTGLVVSLISGGVVFAGEKYNDLEDAAVAQAKRWQSGEKARALMSSDGKVVFPYGQSMPKLTCSPVRACDLEMEPGEKVNQVIVGDGVNWPWKGAESTEKGMPVRHIVFQPVDRDLETNAIVTTDRRSYHIKLYSPKVEGPYLNRVGFYYPEALVTSWAEKMGAEKAAAAKEEGLNVMPAFVSPENMAFDYRLEGDADFKPLRVFNDGERVYMPMPDELKNGENPTLNLLDEKGNLMVVNYRRKVDNTTGAITYIVDKLFAKAELRRGSEKVTISWKRKDKSFWSRSGN